MQQRARALVLTAGLGTRLRPLTCLRAKGALPVNGEPLVRRLVRRLVTSGIGDLVLNLHHKPETIAAVIGDGSDLGARVRFTWEQPVLGSAGGPRRALPLLDASFLIVNGDTLTDVDLAAMAAVHADSGADVTMALVPNARPDKYGGVRVSADGWVTGFSRRGAPGETFHFIGVQVANAAIFADLEDGVPAESVASLYPTLIARNPRAVKAFVSRASFQDIGTPADYLQTCLDLAAREGDHLLAAGTRADSSARVVRTAVWDDVVIGPRAVLTECVVGDRVVIPADARFDRCAIVPSGACEAAPGQRVERGLLIAPL